MSLVYEFKPPNPKQEQFFCATNRHIGYGGARGGGKSWGLRTKFVLLAFNYPKLKLLLLRRTFPELRENHVLPLMEQLYGIAKHKSSENAFIFPNGSRLKLGYCDKEKDIYQYQGQEYDVIGLEEATHFTTIQVQFLQTCNRNTRTDFKPRMYYTANPGGVGHQWFKRLFVDRKYKGKEKAEDYCFISATVDDNTILMQNNPEYVDILDNLPEKLRKAHRYGDWNMFEGQYFEEFVDNKEHYLDRRWTHVIEGFDIPHHWKIFRSFDFGYSKPFSCGWWAMDGDGRIYRILEAYGCTGEPDVGLKWEPNKIFAKIKEIETSHAWLRDKQIVGVADPSIWDSSRGESIANTGEKHGIYFDAGDNKRLAGWMQLRYRFAFDDNGVPMMYIFDNCKDAIRTIPDLVYSERDVEDLDTKGEDHIVDEMRYYVMLNPIAPRKTTKARDMLHDPLDIQPQIIRPSFIQS